MEKESVYKYFRKMYESIPRKGLLPKFKKNGITVTFYGGDITSIEIDGNELEYDSYTGDGIQTYSEELLEHVRTLIEDR